MKRILWPLVLGILIILLLYFGPRIYNRYFRNHGMSSYEEAMYVLNETVKTNVIVYGESVKFDKSFNYTRLSELSKNTLIHDESEYVYSYLVIVDLAGELTIDDDEFEAILEFLEHDDTGLYYFGKNLVPRFQRKRILRGSLQSYSMGFAVVPAGGYKKVVEGFWTNDEYEMYQTDKEFLAKILLIDINYNIKSN